MMSVCDGVSACLTNWGRSPEGPPAACLLKERIASLTIPLSITGTNAGRAGLSEERSGA